MSDAISRAAETSPAAPTTPYHERLYPKGKHVPEHYWAGGAGHELEHWRRRALEAEARVRELETSAARRQSECVHRFDSDGACMYGCGATQATQP